MNRRPPDQRQLTSPKNGSAVDVWLDLLAEVIVSEVLNGEESEGPNQKGEA